MAWRAYCKVHPCAPYTSMQIARGVQLTKAAELNHLSSQSSKEKDLFPEREYVSLLHCCKRDMHGILWAKYEFYRDM